MKHKVFVTLLSAWVLLSSAQGQDHPAIHDIEKKAFLRSHPASGASTRALNNYDVKYHRLEFAVDPAVQFISGRVTTYFKTTTALSQFEFDLSVFLTVDSVKYHGADIAFIQLPGDLARADFPSGIPAGTLDSLSIFYHGVPPGSGLGSFVTDTHAGTPVLWTLSEPYGAKDWWACKQDLQDKIDSIDVFILHPAAYRAVSNGILVAETPLPGQMLTHWKHRSPIAVYLVAIAVSNYAVFTHHVPFGPTNTPIENYVYPEDSVMAYNAVLPCIQQMQLYDTLFGLYPFFNEKYGHTQMGWGGGMEHQTNSFVGGFSYELLAHEMAHQWFGDYITCGSWEDIWLNEGFATYLSGLCYEHLAPEYWMPFKQAQLNTIVSASDGSVFCTDTTDIGRIFSARLTYSKGCMVLNSLRWVMGDSAFYAGINDYLGDPGLAFGFSRLQQFKMHMETACGQDLTWFFDDWYYGEGYPVYHLEWEQDVSNNVTVIVNQSQSHPSVSFFQMPLPLYFKNGTQDTTIVVDHTMDGETFTFPLGFRPDSLLFDPDLWIISAFNLVSGILAPEGPHALNVYPSLADRELFITLDRIRPGEKAIITSAEGKKIMERSLTDFKTTMDISGLARGSYLITVSSDDLRITRRFVKQ